MEFDIFVRFEEVKSAEPPKKFGIFSEKNSRHFWDDFLVASAFLSVERFSTRVSIHSFVFGCFQSGHIYFSNGENIQTSPVVDVFLLNGNVFIKTINRITQILNNIITQYDSLLQTAGEDIEKSFDHDVLDERFNDI